MRPRRAARHATWGEVGFTIIEILVSVAVLGVIVVPMAMAFSAGFRVSEITGASLNASASRDQLAFRFSNDVASVDATGASRSGATCDTSPSGGGTLLITLNTTTQPSATAVSTRVSYWVTGNGVDIDIVRRACSNAVPGVAATNGKATIVAEKVGYPGAIGADTVHGPYDPSIGAMGSPCDEYRCQLEVDGRYRYRVAAQRRAFGAGVPLEVGKVYGSAATRQRDNTMLYEHTTGSGQSRGIEARFTDQLTLAGGLDGPPLLTVKFGVQQMQTGKWLTCPSTVDYSTCSFTASSKTFVSGQYSSNVWRLPLRVGPGEVMAAGGEYRVYTQLQSGASTPKAYGGSNGFPFWVDWYPEDSVFVKPAASGGNDANNGLTPGTAVATVTRALLVSAAENRGEIQVATGNFQEAVVVSGANYADNRTMTGGHDLNNGWLRGTKLPITSKVVGPATGTNGIGYRITGKKLQKFRQMGIQSGPANTTPGSSTFALVIDGGATVMLDYSQVLSSPGRNGQNGTAAVPKGDACLGGNGVASSTASVNNRVGAPVRTATYNGSPYNVVGVPCVNSSQADARWAGYGGGGGNSGLFFADNGSPGGIGGGQPAAQGGAGGAGGFCDGKQGSPGRGGAIEPNPGNAGAPGTTPSWSGFAYAGISGGAGFNGLNGHGGSGAGGAGATNCFGVNAAGSSGGSGGEGGLGGGGGGGGGGAIITSSAPTSTSVAAGSNGITTSGNLQYGSSPGAVGTTSTTAITNIPGVSGGAQCADLSVTKSGPASVTAGGAIAYQLAVSNNGPSAASTVSVTDTLPPGVTFVSVNASGGGWSCSNAGNASVTCTRATWASGASTTF
ncbi:MAG: DUF11 domain-containing protein, partial [Actinobacteria bacterium]|nr:DUF11 domain-containing protein [Actinomycetota bacterium]